MRSARLCGMGQREPSLQDTHSGSRQGQDICRQGMHLYAPNLGSQVTYLAALSFLAANSFCKKKTSNFSLIELTLEYQVFPPGIKLTPQNKKTRQKYFQRMQRLTMGAAPPDLSQHPPHSICLIVDFAFNTCLRHHISRLVPPSF